jgi:Flp pilus assembly pilin Flp
MEFQIEGDRVMIQSYVRLFGNKTGTTSIEYALILGLIAIFLFATVATIDDSLVNFFERAAEPL